jgi:outer membrane protein insertion porin family
LIYNEGTHKSWIQVVMFIAFICYPLTLFSQLAIERVEIRGNKRIPRETILYYFGLRAGYPYEEKAMEEGLEALWATGYFKDIKVAVDKEARGQVVSLFLTEYPIVKKFAFKTEKIKEREILARLHEKDIDFSPYSLYDPQKINRIVIAIQEMLAEKGYNQGKVDFETLEKGRFQVEVLFHIEEGARYRIAEIAFEGNPKLKKSILLGAFQNNKEHNLLSWLKGKDIFRKAKLKEDLDNLKDRYRELGYADVKIGNPVIKEFTRSAFLLGKQRMKEIIVPVDAGDRYSVGKIEIKGNKFFTAQQINPLIQLREGDMYNGRIETRAVERIRELYQNSGYFFAQVLSAEYLDSKNLKIDVTFDIREGDRIYLKRLKIIGNTFTKDIILRREMLVVEQDIFHLDSFSKSLKKLMRSGMVRLEDSPEIRLYSENPTQIDLSLKVAEVYTNEWQLTGGYSGYQGAFFGGNLSTVDFLGAGEKLDLKVEYGERSKNYSIGFFEPYLFDRSLSFRFGLFQRDVVYPDLFDRKGRGIQLGFDVKVEDYWWAGVGYNFEQVDAASYGIGESESATDQNISSVSGFLFRDSVDNPLFPSEGMRCSLSCELAGGPLGSDIQYVKPVFDGTLFFPAFGNNVFGFHLAYRTILPLGDSEVPFWERFYLGGERSLRGYDVYSIGPRDLEGQNRGGEKSLVFNIEYMMPVVGPLFSILFFDAGNAVSRSEKIDLTDLYWSSGLEMRLWISELQVPVRFIFAYNNRLNGQKNSHFAFRLAFGASF